MTPVMDTERRQRGVTDATVYRGGREESDIPGGCAGGVEVTVTFAVTAVPCVMLTVDVPPFSVRLSLCYGKCRPLAAIGWPSW